MPSIEDRLSVIEGRMAKAETPKRRDIWDIAQIVVIPLAVVWIASMYTQASKEREIEIERIRAERDYEIATANARVGQAELVGSLFNDLLHADPRRHTLAAEAVLIALPHTGPALIRAIAQKGGSVASQNASDALVSRQAVLIRQLFGETAGQRKDAYEGLISGWARDPNVIPAVLAYGREHLDNPDGVYNTLVFLSHMNRDTLTTHAAEVEAFSRAAEAVGPRTKQRAEVLRSRLASP